MARSGGVRQALRRGSRFGIEEPAKKSPDQGNRRLQPDRPAHTIRAECHGNIQFHYELDRRISMREAPDCSPFPTASSSSPNCGRLSDKSGTLFRQYLPGMSRLRCRLV